MTDNNLAAARPSTITILTLKTALAYLTRSLLTKTGESPSAVNRLVRKQYAVLIAFDKDFPGYLSELVTAVDLEPRDHGLAWYGARIRAITLALRHELVKQRAEAQPARSREAGQPQGIGAVLAGMG